MQVYRDLVIGTARPTQEEMAGVPHHMMGVADPRENYSVARYVQEATACVEDIFRRGRQPIVVGGTGLYLDALCQGRSFSDFRPETRVWTRLQAPGGQLGCPRAAAPGGPGDGGPAPPPRCQADHPGPGGLV